ncbi:MAG: hypothetical protein ACI9YL_000640 [Luteibaculaceae bacterium]
MGFCSTPHFHSIYRKAAPALHQLVKCGFHSESQKLREKENLPDQRFGSGLFEKKGFQKSVIGILELSFLRGTINIVALRGMIFMVFLFKA